MKNQKLKGKEGFEEFYSNLFQERWLELKAALLRPVKHFEFADNLLSPYYMDKASYLVAKQMPELKEGKCLDMCAAPGGKTLVLANTLGHDVKILANEISRERRNRLLSVLDEHLKEETRSRVEVSGYDASVLPKLAKFRNTEYECILLDAPCSSERHIINSEKALKNWTASRVKNLAIRQWALLSAGFLLLKNEGILIYSTCALTPSENDGGIEKLIKKYKNKVEVIHTEPFENAEKTKHGLIFMPDYSGYGPMYFAKIKKVKTKEA
ncbi:MAG: SAM-dependent methyltransferase [Treponema sp.]|nr:MAG: SAM-dependent methyltransferase [Treponema sp.]